MMMHKMSKKKNIERKWEKDIEDLRKKLTKLKIIYTFEILQEIFGLTEESSEEIILRDPDLGTEIRVKNDFLEILKGIEELYLDDGFRIYIEEVSETPEGDRTKGLEDPSWNELPCFDVYMGNLCDYKKLIH